jgi:hypothetical protein
LAVGVLRPVAHVDLGVEVQAVQALDQHEPAPAVARSAAWRRSGEGASRPRARARATAPLADRVWLVVDAG